MRVQLVCLLLVLLTATVLTQNTKNIKRQYQKFKNQHINEQMTASDCDSVMLARGISNEKHCKNVNTFILANITAVESVCGGDGEPYGDMTKSRERFNIVVCKRKKQRGKKAGKCQHAGRALTRKIIIKCKQCLPVHYDKDIGHCEN